jgi:Raf kinase inhibitor-like YbhB/YbcL family protein
MLRVVGKLLILFIGVVLVFVLIFLTIRRFSGGTPAGTGSYNSFDMTISSSAFKEGELIPAKYTCDGQNVSPSLTFMGIPENTESLVLIVDDPDVPKNIRPDGMWTHWLVWNIPADISVVGEGNTPEGVVGRNSSGDKKYTGPCPPDREHRYFFKLFALDTILDLDASSVSKTDLERAIEGHVLAEAQLMGRYNRPR